MMPMTKATWLAALAAASLWNLQAQASLATPLAVDSLFVCNAGIMHSANEVVSGTDSIVLQYEDPTMPPESDARFLSKTLSAQTESNPSTVAMFPVESDLWIHQITRSQFDFTTEKFGARYFVDLCYRGPEKVVVPGSPTDITEGIYTLDLQVNLNDPTVNGKSYRTTASLATQIETACDLRARGSSTNPRQATEVGVTALERDSWYMSNQASWNSNSLNFQVTLNDSVRSVPRFCKIRISFIERASGVLRDSTMTPRDVNIFVNVDRF